MTLPNPDEATDWTKESLRAWLADLRAKSGLSHDALAEAVGERGRRQTSRWFKHGQEPNGVALVRLLSALGVKFDPPPPHELRSLNDELRDLREGLAELRDHPDQAARHREALLAELEGEVQRWRALNDAFEAELALVQQASGRNGEKPTSP